MKFNSLMSVKLNKINLTGLSFTKELRNCIDEGFVSDDGCVFISCLYNKAAFKKELFPDKTGIECFVNSIHIDDYVSDRYLDYAILFCNEILKKWKAVISTAKLNAIISFDDFGATVRFHVERPDERWLNANLEGYEEAILETNEYIETHHQLY